VQGSGRNVQGAWFRLESSECRMQNSGFRVQGARFRVQGLPEDESPGFVVQGVGLTRLASSRTARNSRNQNGSLKSWGLGCLVQVLRFRVCGFHTQHHAYANQGVGGSRPTLQGQILQNVEFWVSHNSSSF